MGSSRLSEEHARQTSNTQAVLELFQSRPLQWISWQELAKVGGSCAWRTRVSNARRIVRKDGGDIVWNRKLASAYMFTPYRRLGPDAAEYRVQKTLW